MAGLVELIAVNVDVIGHLVLDRMLQGAPGTGSGDLFEGGTNDRLGCKPESN